MDAAYEQSIAQNTQDVNAARDAILALVNLGYSNSEAALAVKRSAISDRWTQKLY